MNGRPFIHYRVWYTRGQMNIGPAQFHKPAGLRPVKGGRWGVRRMIGGERPWRAYTAGKTRSWSRDFHTQAEAFAWAHLVAYCYSLYTPIEADIVLKAIRQGRLIQRAVLEEDGDFRTFGPQVYDLLIESHQDQGSGSPQGDS